MVNDFGIFFFAQPGIVVHTYIVMQAVFDRPPVGNRWRPKMLISRVHGWNVGVLNAFGFHFSGIAKSPATCGAETISSVGYTNGSQASAKVAAAETATKGNDGKGN